MDKTWKRNNKKWSKFKVSKGIKNIVKKIGPKKSWTTLFTCPFINHFREWAHFIYFPFTNHLSTLFKFMSEKRTYIAPPLAVKSQKKKTVFWFRHLPQYYGKIRCSCFDQLRVVASHSPFWAHLFRNPGINLGQEELKASKAAATLSEESFREKLADLSESKRQAEFEDVFEVLKKCSLPDPQKKTEKGELKIRGRQWIWNYMLRQTPRTLPKKDQNLCRLRNAVFGEFLWFSVIMTCWSIFSMAGGWVATDDQSTRCRDWKLWRDSEGINGWSGVRGGGRWPRKVSVILFSLCVSRDVF